MTVIAPSVQDVIEALQTGHLTIPGVVTATTGHPGHLNDADLPQVLVWPGAMNFGVAGAYLMRSDETYIVRVYCAPVGGGTDVNVEGVQKVFDLITEFRNYYSHPTIRHLDGLVAHVGSPNNPLATISCSGFLVLQYAGVSYMSFELTVPLTIKAAVEEP